ncbi:acyl carrier protein [Sphingomicrobium clamense]|uniref:Acyl carrier protein n=1 Tax=Sphingomicrobium clamense TaxID=2851013 RepID=A0ABS6V5V7_9SPHN|nr:phosphopantetheine-binding protein [Sphingomicrobium sp. B8]MBW0144951.1 acyl carrier protein [Sphingomicrobium sp. B8]
MARDDIMAAKSDEDTVDATLRILLANTLGIDAARVARFDTGTELFGALPEFDSMAVAQLLTAMEERLGILIEDDDLEAEDLMTYGRLVAFAHRKALGAV